MLGDSCVWACEAILWILQSSRRKIDLEVPKLIILVEIEQVVVIVIRNLQTLMGFSNGVFEVLKAELSPRRPQPLSNPSF